MNPKVEALAARLRTVLDDYEASRRQDAAAREQELAAARAARAELLQELAAFGRAVGHLQVDAHADRLGFTWGSQRLAFVPVGEGDALRVVIGSLAGPDDSEAEEPGSPVRIYRRGEVWVLAVAHDGVEDSEPLFEQGLLHLLIEGLGMPIPRPPPKPQPPLDDLVPPKS